MKLVQLTLVFCVTAVVVCQKVPEIRRVSIHELLKNNPSLKAELTAKINAGKDDSGTPKAPTTRPTTATTTTTPAPQADSPPAAPAEATTPVAEAGNGQRRRGNRRNGGGSRRRRPVSAESDKFAETAPHRLRVVPKETSGDAATPARRQNGRTFPGAS